jgi:hypothetical protein
VHKKVFYVGDSPDDIVNWANEFSKALRGTKVKIVPAVLVYSLGLLGDVLKLFGITFPITTSRYKSMTTSNSAPMEKTFEILGDPPYSLEQGVAVTVNWLRRYHPDLVRV